MTEELIENTHWIDNDFGFGAGAAEGTVGDTGVHAAGHIHLKQKRNIEIRSKQNESVKVMWTKQTQTISFWNLISVPKSANTFGKLDDTIFNHSVTTKAVYNVCIMIFLFRKNACLYTSYWTPVAWSRNVQKQYIRVVYILLWSVYQRKAIIVPSF